jgi:hypothetical protein
MMDTDRSAWTVFPFNFEIVMGRFVFHDRARVRGEGQDSTSDNATMTAAGCFADLASVAP